MKTTALGLIEVRGYVGAIEAADAALKAANVQLIKLERIKSGLVTVLLSGDVGAIHAAVEAGTEAAEKCGTIISSHVIARPHEETTKVLLQPKQKQAPPVETAHELDETAHELDESAPELVETVIMDDVVTSTDPKGITRLDLDELEGKKVEDLRKLARHLHIRHVKPNQIKYGRKEFLIQILTDYYREGASE